MKYLNVVIFKFIGVLDYRNIDPKKSGTPEVLSSLFTNVTFITKQ